jgi:hypothetical protein
MTHGLLFLVFFAGRHDSSAPKSEGRKSIAQSASTGNRAQDGLAPEQGVAGVSTFSAFVKTNW